MKCAVLCVLLVATCLSGAEATNPIKKVLQMMQDLQDKVIAQGVEEQKIYEQKTEFCEEKAKKLAFEIKTGTAEIAELKATVDQQNAVIEKATAKVEELSSDISTNEADLKDATAVREKEKAEFTAEEAQSKEIIDSLDRAIAVLTREMAKHGASMLQLQSSKSITDALSVLVEGAAISAEDSSKLNALVENNALLQEDEEYGELAPPEASATEGHSGGILSQLEGLLEKAEEQLDKARKAEVNSQGNYNMLEMSLKGQIKYGNKDLDEVKKQLAEATEKLATAKGDLEVTSKDLAGDKKSKEALKQDCMSAAQEFELSTSSRAEELKAVDVAKKIIQESCGGAEKQAYGLDQTALLQVGSSTASLSFHAVRFVRDLADKQHSPVLTQLASRMQSIVRLENANGQDPFAKVKSLIGDMLKKLESEAADDASQKAYCDKELADTTEKEDEKDTEVKGLGTKINQKTSSSGKLHDQVSTLQDEIGGMLRSEGQATQIRTEEKADYEKNKAEMEQGLKGVQMASAVLREYYAKEDKGHETESAEGMGGNILGLLEVVESDLTKGLAKLTEEEESAAAEYDEFMDADKIDKIGKEGDVKHKTREYKGLDKSLSELGGDLSGVQDESDAIHEYDTKIKKSCTTKADPYEERKKRREDEIAGLKEALSNLDQQAASLIQTSSKRTLRGRAQ